MELVFCFYSDMLYLTKYSLRYIYIGDLKIGQLICTAQLLSNLKIRDLVLNLRSVRSVVTTYLLLYLEVGCSFLSHIQVLVFKQRSISLEL